MALTLSAHALDQELMRSRSRPSTNTPRRWQTLTNDDVVPLQITRLALDAERATELIAIGLVANAEIVEPHAHWLWLVVC